MLGCSRCHGLGSRRRPGLGSRRCHRAGRGLQITDLGQKLLHVKKLLLHLGDLLLQRRDPQLEFVAAGLLCRLLGVQRAQQVLVPVHHPRRSLTRLVGSSAPVGAAGPEPEESAELPLALDGLEVVDVRVVPRGVQRRPDPL